MTRQSDWQNWLSTLEPRVRYAVSRTSRKQEIRASWTLVIIPDAGPISVSEHDSAEALAAAVQPHIGTDVTALLYYGKRLWLSGEPERCLLLPGGKNIPIAGIDGDPTQDAEGYLGGSEPILTPDVSVEEEDSDEYETEYDDPADTEGGVAIEEPEI